MKKILFTGSLALGLAVITGCASSSSKSSASFAPVPGIGVAQAPAIAPVKIKNEISTDLLRPDSSMMTLGPGDQIEAELIGTTGSRSLLSVGPDGKIYFSLLPGIDVWGMTLVETKARLEKELANYFNAPRVAVTLKAVGSKQVWLMGRLKKPGVYPMTSPITLLEAIAEAGGTSRSDSQISSAELSDLRHSFVVRGGQFLPVNFDSLLRHGDMSQNIYLRPGDFVYVPFALSQQVYVMGAVRNPKALPFSDQMSLVTAIASTAGTVTFDILDKVDTGVTTANADLSRIAVVRGSLSEPQVFIVNYHDIIKGKAPDFALEPGDIINVPNSPYTTLKRYVNMIVSTFSATVAANEGVRAGGGTVSVGVSVPVK